MIKETEGGIGVRGDLDTGFFNRLQPPPFNLMTTQIKRNKQDLHLNFGRSST